MDATRTQRELLEALASEGRIDPETVEDVLNAPRWSFATRELITYLAAIIALTGIARILGFFVPDLSSLIAAGLLALLGAVFAFAAVKMKDGTLAVRRFAEVLEGLSIVCFVGSAILFIQSASFDPAPEVVALVISVPLSWWGFLRSRASQFIGSAELTVGVTMFVFSLVEVVFDTSWDVLSMGVPALIGGTSLVVLGQRRTGGALLQRVTGDYLVLLGSFVFLGEWGRPGPLVPLATGAALYALGAARMRFDSLVAGAIAVTVGLTSLVGDWLPNELARGLVTLAIAGVMVASVGVHLPRRGRQSTSD